MAPVRAGVPAHPDDERRPKRPPEAFVQARARLARLVGRLLACHWLERPRPASPIVASRRAKSLRPK